MVNFTPLPPAIFLMGPTAAGKTALAVSLTQSLPCEIISVDSALVYRGMDIGTAKPCAEILAYAPHRLIDICDPAQPYCAEQFRRDALRMMAEITDKGKIPLLTGGTGLYFRALEQGLAVLPQADVKLRQQLEQEAQAKGWAALHQQLQQLDKQTAARIHPNDPQRIQRALEVCLLTGQTMSSLVAQQQQAVLPYQVIKIIITPQQREVLHERIAQRFQAMLDQGLLGEVEKLYQRPDIHPDLPSMRAVGYRQVWRYLDRQWDYATMTEKAIIATRQLAKRQLTWLRGQTAAIWFDPQMVDAQTQLNALVVQQLNKYYKQTS